MRDVASLPSLLPFEFTVAGPPVTLQAKNASRKRDWIQKVRSAAMGKWPRDAHPHGGPVRLMLTYYHDKDSPAVDADNLIKPIQDALIGVVYVDDRQVRDVDGAKRNIDERFEVRYMSVILAEAFCVGQEFVHIKVDHAPDPGALRK